jgi:hypothetical protein
MIKRFKILMLCAALSYGLTAVADGYAVSWIVTPQEMSESNLADSGLRPRSAPVKDAPVIELVTPKLPGELASPLQIELKFNSTLPSTIRPEAFKALYGTFQIDITSRILGVTNITPSGIQVKEANLPKGNHRILLMLEDTEGRVGSRWMEFRVN